MKIQTKISNAVKRNPDGTLDFRPLQGQPIAICCAIGKRCYEFSLRATDIRPGEEHVKDRMTATMMMGVVFLCRHGRYDLLRCLESEPLTFWDEMRLISRNIITQPLARFPDDVKLRFAQSSALN